MSVAVDLSSYDFELSIPRLENNLFGDLNSTFGSCDHGIKGDRVKDEQTEVIDQLVKVSKTKQKTFYS